MGDRGEIKIPVFSVLKNGVILKNIFLNNPHWDSKPSSSDIRIEEHDEDDPMLIGRHPDCHIVLDHPSISRFHLEIRAKPASQHLAVVDRSSVHGTWVSGSRIQPNVAVDLREGDMVKLGASTRVYKLHWVPVSCAFEMEMPLPAVLEENEETHQLENLNEVWAEEIPSAPPLPESLSLPVETGNQSPLKELGEKSPSFCSADPMSESVGFSLHTEGENRTPEKNGNANEVQSERECMSPLTSGKKGKPLSILSRRIKSKSVNSLHIQTGRSRWRSCNKGLEVGNQENNATLEVYNREETLCRVLFDNEKENEKEEIFVSAKENTTPLSSTGQNSHVSMQDKEAWTPKAPSSEKQIRPISANCLEEEGDEVHASDKENLTPVVPSRHRLRKRLDELQISSLNNEEVFYSDKENWTPEVLKEKKSKKLIYKDCLRINGDDEKEAIPSDKENLTPDVPGSKKSKKPLPWDFWQVDGEEEFSDKENITPNVSGTKKSKKKLTDSQARAKREMVERRKERIPFQPLWKNSPKNGSPLNHSQRIVDEERSPFRSLFDKSSLKNCSSPLSDARRAESKEKVPFQSLFDKSSLKNCSSPLSDAQRAESKEKVPFQSLLENSPSQPSSSLSHPQRTVDEEGALFQCLHNSPLRNSSPVSNAQKIVDTGNKYPTFIHSQRTEDELSNSSSQSVEQVLLKAGGNKKKWNMVVDTDCFLNEESRKALQLLEGLKGTQLIIPRIVIRELDCLRRRESLFRKNTKAASSVLQWIEECMVRSSWWIHVQSTLETMPVAPTPPATPRELADGSDDLSTGGSNSTAFSTCGSLLEIVSPTAEDHILDCALLFKRIKDEGQLMLLTDSITLKIKAMAEGLLCESASMFRESLVNPYSKRYLWSDSSPRGSTWSCLDEVGMIENYYQQFPAVRNTSRPSESIRGLKLILLHNSHYRKTSSVN